MSVFHLENYDGKLGLRVRIKTVDLDHCRSGCATRNGSKEQAASIATLSSECKGPIRLTGTEISGPAKKTNSEICMDSGKRVSCSDFESHIEECKVCASRVELQLDFIETLEAAVCQRIGEPESEKIKGALLIGAPELNFAVCGEIDFNENFGF